MKTIKFGVTLRALRTCENMSQKELAQKVGVDESTIRYWENENGQTSYENLYKIALIFNISIGQLLGVED